MKPQTLLLLAGAVLAWLFFRKSQAKQPASAAVPVSKNTSPYQTPTSPGGAANYFDWLPGQLKQTLLPYLSGGGVSAKPQTYVPVGSTPSTQVQLGGNVTPIFEAGASILKGLWDTASSAAKSAFGWTKDLEGIANRYEADEQTASRLGQYGMEPEGLWTDYLGEGVSADWWGTTTTPQEPEYTEEDFQSYILGAQLW